MRLPRRIRHWLLIRLSDGEFTARSGWHNHEALLVIRAGCLQKLKDDARATPSLPQCGNPNCWLGRNAWHSADCEARNKGKN